MIPFGSWRPDIGTVNAAVCLEAQNVLPDPVGFRPLLSLSSASNALDGDCLGAAVMLAANGNVHSFAGTATSLYRLGGGSIWEDVTGAGEPIVDQAAAQILDEDGNIIRAEGEYAVTGGERWNFASFGDIVVAVSIAAETAKFDVTSSTDFEPLGGTPPSARYITVVRDFLVLGCIEDHERRIQWSGINNIEHWTSGTQSSDFQDFPAGGPVRGLIGGEVGYVFQAEKVSRMTFVPGSDEIFQFDEIEGGRGLAAPASLVKIGRTAYYRAQDGFYKFDIGSGESAPIGVGKWSQWFQDDIKSGTEQVIYGGVDPVQRLIVWAYVPKSATGQVPTRLLIYKWDIDEATYADVPVRALAQWLTAGLSLDELGAFGTLDTLPFSLDSSVWKGGAGILGVFGEDDTLAYFASSPMQAQIVTADGFKGRRVLVKATRPHVDTTSVSVAIAARERDGDTVTFGASEALEDTGECPAHVSGNYARARITIAAGANWGAMKGVETRIGSRGAR